MLVIFSFPVLSLVEQAMVRGRQDQKERRMTMELKAAVSDRDSLKAELAVTQNRWVLYGVQSLFF